MNVGRGWLRLRDEADAAGQLLLLPLLAVYTVFPHGAAHALEQFVRSERFYEMANHVGFDCLCPRPLVRIGGHENGRDRSIRSDQVLL